MGIMHFLAQTKGRRERERERKRKGKEKGIWKLEVRLWQKRKTVANPPPPPPPPAGNLTQDPSKAADALPSSYRGKRHHQPSSVIESWSLAWIAKSTFRKTKTQLQWKHFQKSWGCNLIKRFLFQINKVEWHLVVFGFLGEWKWSKKGLKK